MKEGIETTEHFISDEGTGSTGLQSNSETLPSQEFVKVEKNLASLGFFTPSSKRLRNAQEKSFTITTFSDGKRLELKGTIIPSAKYGLPITADQDKWIALCKILTDILQREGRVTNPVSFTSADILRLLRKHRHSGKNYREVEEWLDVLFSTTIFSEGVVYLANEKRRVKDRFRVFDRAVSVGKELSDGKVADKNYVWLSDWQLQNINSNHLLPIDLEAYRQLKNHISKALVPLLQVWLYATRDEGVFEKRYEELCQILNIQQYQYLSLITRTLGPSLEELRQFGYIADWQIEKTSDEQSYKIILRHGEKFHRDRRARMSKSRGSNSLEDGRSRNEVAKVVASSADWHDRVVPRERLRTQTPPSPPTFDPQLIEEFTRRGITEKKASEILANLKPGQDVVAQLEYVEQMVKTARYPIVNPPGFYVRLIESNTTIPDSFETSAKRTAREEREQKERDRRAEENAREELEWEYDTYCQQETDRYVADNPDRLEAIKEAKRIEDREKHPNLSPDLIESFAVGRAERDIRKQVPLLTFEEFVNQKEQNPDFFLKPVSVSPDSDPQPEPAAPQVAPAIDGASILETTSPQPEPVAFAAEAGELVQPAIESATLPEISGSAIELSAPADGSQTAISPETPNFA